MKNIGEDAPKMYKINFGLLGGVEYASVVNNTVILGLWGLPGWTCKEVGVNRYRLDSTSGPVNVYCEEVTE